MADVFVSETEAKKGTAEVALTNRLGSTQFFLLTRWSLKKN